MNLYLELFPTAYFSFYQVIWFFVKSDDSDDGDDDDSGDKEW